MMDARAPSSHVIDDVARRAFAGYRVSCSAVSSPLGNQRRVKIVQVSRRDMCPPIKVSKHLQDVSNPCQLLPLAQLGLVKVYILTNLFQRDGRIETPEEFVTYVYVDDLFIDAMLSGI